jgi:uncharacterized membrane protein YeiH
MLHIIEIAEIVGTISFAMSGFLVAVSSRLDLLGIFISSFLTALGGGVIRDIILDREIFAFSNNYISLIVLFVVLVAIYFGISRLSKVKEHPLFITTDTIGLVSFSISGALLALDGEFSFMGVVLIALITAVGGGVLRDMLINEIPMILISEFYGSVALLLGFMLYLLKLFGLLNSITISFVFIFGLSIRYIALKRDWHLPRLK